MPKPVARQMNRGREQELRVPGRTRGICGLVCLEQQRQERWGLSCVACRDGVLQREASGEKSKWWHPNPAGKNTPGGRTVPEMNRHEDTLACEVHEGGNPECTVAPVQRRTKGQKEGRREIREGSGYVNMCGINNSNHHARSVNSGLVAISDESLQLGRYYDSYCTEENRGSESLNSSLKITQEEGKW